MIYFKVPIDQNLDIRELALIQSDEVIFIKAISEPAVAPASFESEIGKKGIKTVMK